MPQDSMEYGNSTRRSRSRDGDIARRRSPSRDRDGGRDSRRRSPMYEEYRKRSDSPPWRKQENMYPNRGNRGHYDSGRGWGDDYLTRSVVAN